VKSCVCGDSGQGESVMASAGQPSLSKDAIRRYVFLQFLFGEVGTDR